MAPDWYTETYPGTRLDAGIRRDVSPEFASIEYDHDPDPNDSTLESVFIYIIKDADGYPALYLNIGFDRAWATVSQALERAEIPVEDTDSIEALVLAVFPTAGPRGWMKRIVPGGESGENTPVVIRVARDGDDRAVVSVERPEGGRTEPELAEEVLVTVRAFAA